MVNCIISLRTGAEYKVQLDHGEQPGPQSQISSYRKLTSTYFLQSRRNNELCTKCENQNLAKGRQPYRFNLVTQQGELTTHNDNILSD